MRILCATDLLPKSESALERAGRLASRVGASLSIVHAVTYAESASMLEEEMRRAGMNLTSRTKPPLWTYGGAPTVLVRGGHPERVLAEAARDLDASLVVLGVHRRRLASDALFGSLAERLLRTLECPVLIVRRMPLGAYRNVLVAVDGSVASAEAVRSAERWALVDGARASVVHGCVRESAHEVRARLVDLLAAASVDPSRYELILERARTAAGAVTSAVRRVNPDLLVMGTHRHGSLERALFGSITSSVLTTRRSDVLVVPHRREDEIWRRRRPVTRELIDPWVSSSMLSMAACSASLEDYRNCGSSTLSIT